MDYSLLGSILGFPYFGKLPNYQGPSDDFHASIPRVGREHVALGKTHPEDLSD